MIIPNCIALDIQVANLQTLPKAIENKTSC